MFKRSLNRGFAFIDLLVVISMIGILIALLLPSLGTAREEAQRNRCQLKIKMIGLVLLNHESAYIRFPLVYNAPNNLFDGKTPQALVATPAGTGSGAIPGKMTGWSWIVRILPYMEESNLYKAIDINSSQFSIDPPGGNPPSNAPGGPFDKAVVNGSHTYQHCSCVALSQFICPSWSGDANTNGTTTIDATDVPATGKAMPTGAPEYAKLKSIEPTTGVPPGFVDLPGPTNYKALVGTHLQTAGNNAKAPVENGVMLLSAFLGVKINSITDGLSNTLLVAETRECGYASWYDGTMNWLVANSPSAKVAPGTNGQAPWINAQIAINRGYDPTQAKTAADATNVPYLSSGLSINGIKGNENWGPSSQHTNGVVMHVFGDGHVLGITDQCDPETYLDLTTRAGAEAIDTTRIR